MMLPCWIGFLLLLFKKTCSVKNWHRIGSSNAHFFLKIIMTTTVIIMHKALYIFWQRSFQSVRDHFPEYFLVPPHSTRLLFPSSTQKLCVRTIIIFLLRDTRALMSIDGSMPDYTQSVVRRPTFLFANKKLQFVNGNVMDVTTCAFPRVKCARRHTISSSDFHLDAAAAEV